MAPISYPPARRDETVVDDYHGVQVPDPYRWLEDPDAEETKEFVGLQNEITKGILATCDVRDKFEKRMTELFDYPRYGCPFKYGDNTFYFYNSGLQPQSVLYIQETPESEPEVLLDPNTLSDDGTVALSSYAFSEDGRYLAYGLSASGSDWQTIHVMQVKSREKLPEVLKWVKFSSLAWTHDHQGFFYNRYQEPSSSDADAGTETDINLNQKLFYHFLGTEQSEDCLCWEDPANPQWMFGAEVSDDGKFLIMSISSGCDPVNRLYYTELDSLTWGRGGESLTGMAAFKRLSSGSRRHGLHEGSTPGLAEQEGQQHQVEKEEKKVFLPMVKLVDNFDAKYDYVANDGDSFTFHTNLQAPKYKLVRVALSQPDTWTDLVPESPTDVLEWVRCVAGDKLLACYMHDVKNVVQVLNLSDGSLLRHLPLDIGSVSSSSGRRCDSVAFYSFVSFLNPGVIFKCDLSKEHPVPEVFREIRVNGFDPSLFETEQVFVPSTDGTRIPMFIVARKGTQSAAASSSSSPGPALLYGYGGFNISITPSFSVARVLLMQHLGLSVAIANIRGGGEYGETWHKAGSLGAKQNCFDDFASCARHLISSGITTPSQLCIEGGSNGGLLVAASMNQHPELFGCVLGHVGVMDMLRFHKFTIGHAWTTDYGSSDDPEQFQWLIKYSPLHNVKRPWEAQGNSENSIGTAEQRATNSDVQYPSTMLLTGDHDDRVVPLHSLKLIATLQHELVNRAGSASPQTNPLLVRVDVKSGHGAGRPTKKRIAEVSDSYSFMAKVMGLSWID